MRVALGPSPLPQKGEGQGRDATDFSCSSLREKYLQFNSPSRLPPFRLIWPSRPTVLCVAMSISHDSASWIRSEGAFHVWKGAAAIFPSLRLRNRTTGRANDADEPAQRIRRVAGRHPASMVPRRWNSPPTAACSCSNRAGTSSSFTTTASTWTALHLNVDSPGERGLLGIAFDPAFASNHFVYLYYTNPNAGAAPWATGEHNQLSRFTVNDSDPQQPDLHERSPDPRLEQPQRRHQPQRRRDPLRPRRHALRRRRRQRADLHPGRNTYRVSQTLANLLGKQLRIDVGAVQRGASPRATTPRSGT